MQPTVSQPAVDLLDDNQMLPITLSQLPKYYRDHSEYYWSHIHNPRARYAYENDEYDEYYEYDGDDDDAVILAPKNKMFINESVQSVDDILHLIHTMLFWQFNKIPDIMFDYIIYSQSDNVPPQHILNDIINMVSIIPDIKKTNIIYQIAKAFETRYAFIADKTNVLTRKLFYYNCDDLLDYLLRHNCKYNRRLIVQLVEKGHVTTLKIIHTYWDSNLMIHDNLDSLNFATIMLDTISGISKDTIVPINMDVLCYVHTISRDLGCSTSNKWVKKLCINAMKSQNLEAVQYLSNCVDPSLFPLNPTAVNPTSDTDTVNKHVDCLIHVLETSTAAEITTDHIERLYFWALTVRNFRLFSYLCTHSHIIPHANIKYIIEHDLDTYLELALNNSPHINSSSRKLLAATTAESGKNKCLTMLYVMGYEVPNVTTTSNILVGRLGTSWECLNTILEPKSATKLLSDTPTLHQLINSRTSLIEHGVLPEQPACYIVQAYSTTHPHARDIVRIYANKTKAIDYAKLLSKTDDLTGEYLTGEYLTKKAMSSDLFAGILQRQRGYCDQISVVASLFFP